MEILLKSHKFSLISLVLITLSSASMANTTASQNHYKELKDDIKSLKDAKDPNINKVYKKLHKITSDGVITDLEKQELKIIIDSNKKLLNLSKNEHLKKPSN